MVYAVDLNVHTKVNHSRVLHEIRLFIQRETQCSDLHRGLASVGETISIRYTEIERRLTSVLNDVEVCEQVGKYLYLYSSHSMPPYFSDVILRYEVASL